MWKNKAQKEKELKEKIEKLQEERDKLKEETTDLKLEKKTTDEDIKHMLKKQKEITELDKQKFELKCTREKEEAVAGVKDTYRDKLEAQLKEETKNIKSMYSEILKRLPNVNARLEVK